MAAEWYQEPGWSDEDQIDFERRLRRTRGSRPQCVYGKAVALLRHDNLEGGRSLLERVLADYPDDWFFRVQALGTLGDLSRADGDLAATSAYYREAIAAGPDGNGVAVDIEMSLAEVLIERGDQASLDEASERLDAWLAKARMPLPFQLFRFQVALIRYIQALGGDRDAERGRALAALALLEQAPPFPRHPTAGVATSDAVTIQWLKQLAR